MKAQALSLFFATFSLIGSASQTDLPGPAGSGAFGSTVTVLPNGNFVVTDPLFDQLSPPVADVGAVYLYTPEGALISTLKGSSTADQVGKNGVVILKTGHFLVLSQSWDNTGAADAGAVTWGSSDTGFGAALVVVSAANSLVGGSANDHVGSFVTHLTNGNYVILSHEWDNPSPAAIDAGATTWGNGYTGTVGLVSSANSLVGTTASDSLISFVTALSNGNYVVSNGAWDNGVVENAGAVTWGDGTTGIHGVISAANSLVGTSGFDNVGGNQIVALSNGNYVVGSPYWNNTSPIVSQAGAATWGNGHGGTIGAVSSANSLVGGTDSDSVGGGITDLPNGNYVVGSPYWDNPSPATVDVGAATWGNGSTGTTGIVSAANSLIGSTTLDNVSDGGGIIPLANGNYLVLCSYWDNGVLSDAGSATWGNGAVGVSGPIGPGNSLVGGSANDRVGGNALALANGNYVIISALWNNPSPAVVQAGAATWGNGSTGVKGLISAANSLVGTSDNDMVGASGGAALSNGNYVIASDRWGSADVGAVTWSNGATGIKGPVTAANSLVGTHGGDNIGRVGVTALPNGNYVILSANWDNAAVSNAGAVTWGNGTTGIKGPVTSANSLVGTSPNDLIGVSEIKVLPNSNYLVRSPMWDNSITAVTNAGAVTWGDGGNGISGPITLANSVTGVTLNDQVGNMGLFTFSDSSYIIISTICDNPSPVTVDAGAVTLGDGATGTTGLVSTTNSVLGTAASGGISLVFGYDPGRRQMIVGRKNSNLVSIVNKRLRSIAKTNLDAPGALDIAYATPGSAAINADGDVLADFTLIGAGSVGGKNKAMFFGEPLDLVMQSGDMLSSLGDDLPSNAKATTLSNQSTQQAHRGLFQATVSGTGVSTTTNRLLLMDNSFGVSLLHRTGQPIAALANAATSGLIEVLQSHDSDLIAISYQLKASAAPMVNTSNDSGLLLMKHNGTVLPNVAAREGAPAFGVGGGTFGTFTGRAAAGQGSTVHFAALYKPTTGPAVSALFSTTDDGSTNLRSAAVGDLLAIPFVTGDGVVKFASLPAFTQQGTQPLFKASLGGCASSTNEGLFRSASIKLIRKGDDVDVTNLPGVKFGSIRRFWPIGANQIILQATLTGTGVTAANNQALILHQADNAHLVLLRTGSPAPGCGPAKLLAISAVDVNPVSGRYVVLGTLSGVLATNNQALWTGDPGLGNDTTLQILRQPILRLRKGQTYSTENTPLSTVRSLTLKPVVDASGAGGRGLAHCIGANGDVAVYLLGDRGLTELVVLPQ